jgi:CRISPR-associated protein Cas2
VPVGLRGHLTRWLLEISPGVFVGHVSARVRQLVWQRITEFDFPGRAVMVHPARTEQHLAFQVHGHDWEPVDFDGVHLIRRPVKRVHGPGDGDSNPHVADI